MKSIQLALFLSLILLTFSCKKEEPAADNATTTNTSGNPIITTENTLIYTIGTSQFKLQNGVNSYSFSPLYSWYSGPLADSVYFTAYCDIRNYSLPEMPGLSISFPENYLALNDIQNNKAKVYDSVFVSGDRNFQFDPSSSNHLVQINLIDADGTNWSSYGIQPSDAKFTITSSYAGTDGSGNPTRKIKGEFSVRLFDSLGNTKDLTKAAFYFTYK